MTDQQTSRTNITEALRKALAYAFERARYADDPRSVVIPTGRATMLSSEVAAFRQRQADTVADFIEQSGVAQAILAAEPRCSHPLSRRSRRTGARLDHCGQCGATIYPEPRSDAVTAPDVVLPTDAWKRIGEWVHDHSIYTKDQPDTVDVQELYAFLNDLTCEPTTDNPTK